ncbi:hypothetical protein ACVWYN_000419 [Pedobacter sp. UYP24]
MVRQNKLPWLLLGFLTFGCHGDSNKKSSQKRPQNIVVERIVFSPDKINYVTNTDQDISSLLKTGDKLVLRYSSLNCWSCVEDCLNVIRSETLLGNIDRQSVLIFTSDYNQRDFMLFHKKYLTDYSIYHLSSKIGLKMEMLNYPFLFIIDTNRVIKETYMPVKHKHIALKAYLSRVSKKYLKK